MEWPLPHPPMMDIVQTPLRWGLELIIEETVIEQDLDISRATWGGGSMNSGVAQN